MFEISFETLVAVGEQLQATKYYVTAMLVVLLYEHLLTLEDEIKFIWSRPLTLGNILFYVSRYYAPLAFSICVASVLSPVMSAAVCQSLAPIQPLGLLVVALVVSGTLLFLRVFVLYNHSRVVLTYLGSLLTVQIGVSIFLFTFPGSTVFPVPKIDSPVFHGCLYIPSPRLSLWASSVLVLELIYNLSVFSLVVAKAWNTASSNALGLHGLMYLLITDGALYFAVIFTIIFVWFMMDLLAPVGLKCINALPASVMVVVMINRLTINLHRKLQSLHEGSEGVQEPVTRWMISSHRGTLDEAAVMPDLEPRISRRENFELGRCRPKT